MRIEGASVSSGMIAVLILLVGPLLHPDEVPRGFNFWVDPTSVVGGVTTGITVNIQNRGGEIAAPIVVTVEDEEGLNVHLHQTGLDGLGPNEIGSIEGSVTPAKSILRSYPSMRILFIAGDWVLFDEKVRFKVIPPPWLWPLVSVLTGLAAVAAFVLLFRYQNRETTDE